MICRDDIVSYSLTKLSYIILLFITRRGVGSFEKFGGPGSEGHFSKKIRSVYHFGGQKFFRTYSITVFPKYENIFRKYLKIFRIYGIFPRN